MTPSSVRLAYRYGAETRYLPDALAFHPLVVDVPDPPPLAQPRAEVKRLLESLPEDYHPQPNGSVTIIVPDLTRPLPLPEILSPLCAWLQNHKVPGKNIRILIANGSHRLLTNAEIQSWLGEDLVKLYWVQNHDCRDEENLAFLGYTPRGIPIILNRLVIESDLLILVGGINFHYLAGFGGGRKLIAPGVAGLETILGVHQLSLLRYEDHPEGASIRTGELIHNPFHQELNYIMNSVGPRLSLQVLVDEKSRAWKILVGDPEHTFWEGCQIYAEAYRLAVPAPADLTIAAAGGHPRDINLYQAHKAMDNAVRVTRPGGVLILAAACPEGWGSKEFEAGLNTGDAEEVLKNIRENFSVPGHTAYAALLKAQTHHIVLISQLNADMVRRAGMTPATDMDQALKLAHDFVKRPETVYFIPRAQQILPDMK